MSARRKGSRWKHRKKVETLRDPELDPSPLIEREKEKVEEESLLNAALSFYIKRITNSKVFLPC